MGHQYIVGFHGRHLGSNPNFAISFLVKLQPLQMGFGANLCVGSLGILRITCLSRRCAF